MSQENQKNVFTETLPRVLKLLCRLTNPISDDTCLQRLLDAVKDTISTDEDFLRAGCIQFVQDITKNIETVEPSVITFCLQLTGDLVKQEKLYVQNQGVFEGLFNKVREKNLIKDSSVGTAYFNSLTSVTQLRPCLEWQQQAEGLVFVALSSLKEEGSVFLQTAARRLLVTIISKILQITNPPTRICSFISDIRLTLVKDLARQQELCNTGLKPGSRYLRCLLDLWLDLLKICPHLLQEEQSLRDCILKLVFCGPNDVTTLAEELMITSLMCLPQDQISNFVKTAIIPQIETEIRKNSVSRPHRLAVKLVKRCCPVDSSQCGFLLDIARVPLCVLFVATSPSVKDDVISIVEIVMQNKINCTRLLMQTADVVLSQSAEVETVEQVIRILENTCPLVNVAPLPCSSNIHNHLVHNTKLQQRILECLKANVEKLSKFGISLVERSLISVMQVGRQPLVDPGIYKMSQDCTLSVLEVLSRNPSYELVSLDRYIGQMLEQLERRTVEIRWEIRDTAIETFGKLLDTFKASENVLSSVRSSRLPLSAWQCSVDRESYVRATAVMVAGIMATISKVWDKLVCETNQSEEVFVDNVIMILETDTEAFPRRAAVEFLHSLYSHGSLKDQIIKKIFSAMCRAMQDFDWDVKSKTLDFWETVIEKLWHNARIVSVPEYAASLQIIEGNKRNMSDDSSTCDQALLSALLETGCCDALWVGLEDYDQSVREKACKLMQILKLKLPTDFVTIPKKQKVTTLEYSHANISSGNQSYSISLNGKKYTKLSELYEDTTETKVTNFTDRLQELDVDKMLIDVSGSVDEYAKNPVSLLEDILTADTTEETEIIVDCY